VNKPSSVPSYKQSFNGKIAPDVGVAMRFSPVGRNKRFGDVHTRDRLPGERCHDDVP